MSSNSPNHESFIPAMSEIAREAGALLMDYFHQHLKIEYKGDADLVTAADRAAEALIRDRIRARWPGHDVLGEEQGLNDQGSDYRWYVDPLDGTTNFAHGYPVFCVSMGLEKRLSAGEASRVAAVIYDPTRDELFTAEQGKGAWLNGEAIHVSKTPTLKESLLATGFPSHKRHKNPNIFFYHQITLRTHGVRRAGSAALDLCNVASGRYDGFWEFNLNPWDTAAGVLIVEEAGGRVTRFDGSPFELNSRETVASNGLLHEALLAEFQEIFAGRGMEPLPDPREYKR
ncbi:MAG TPA: inositol monophosphatase family protein [Candidatus Sulfotelmatobacter sp.]|jgi:myo-inositol-1(or 4)-monophosphatase|nr:inositol monophosphatase family protein [Candidatus Sulfotelmatobacter sp.]